MKPFSWVEDYIRDLARKYPERKTDDQYFTTATRPCCIVGHVFEALGAGCEGEEIINKDGELVLEEGSTVDAADWHLLGVEYPNPSQAEWIKWVQLHQDAGESWDRAVALASRA